MLLQEKIIFKCPSLTLSTVYSIEAGDFSMHQIREMHHTNKKKLIFSAILYQETTCLINLGKKAEPTLNIFGPELTRQVW